MKITVNVTRNIERTEKKPYGYCTLYLNDEFTLGYFQIRKNLKDGNYFVSPPTTYYNKNGVEVNKAIYEVSNSFKGVADKIIEAYTELENKNEKEIKIRLGDENKPYLIKATTSLKTEENLKKIGNAKINIDNMFTIYGISVFKNDKDEINIKFPTYISTSVEGIKEYKEFCKPFTNECRIKFINAVKESVDKAYEWQKNHPKAENKTQSQTQDNSQTEAAQVQ